MQCQYTRKFSLFSLSALAFFVNVFGGVTFATKARICASPLYFYQQCVGGNPYFLGYSLLVAGLLLWFLFLRAVFGRKEPAIRARSVITIAESVLITFFLFTAAAVVTLVFIYGEGPGMIGYFFRAFLQGHHAPPDSSLQYLP